MPTLSSEYYSVDTLQVMNAGQAFLSGKAGVAGNGVAEALSSMPDWGDSWINTALVAVAVFISVVSLNRLANMMPFLAGSISWNKPVMSVENNNSLKRERNMLTGVAMIVFFAYMSRFSLLQFNVFDEYDPGIVTLLNGGVFLGYLFVRFLMYRIMMPQRRGKEYYKASYTVYFNFLILLTVLFSITVGVCHFAKVNDLTIRHILLYESIGAGFLLFVRKLDLSKQFCSLFGGFLYLCILELFPAALLISASLFF